MNERIAQRAWTIFGRVVLVALVPLATCSYDGWRHVSMQVQNNSQAIDQLRMIGFTQEQGLLLGQRILSKLAEPPRWLTDSVSRLERAAERMDQQVAGMKERLARIEEQLREK